MLVVFLIDWEQRKLGEIVKSKKIKKYIVRAEEKGAHPVIQQGDKPIDGYSDCEPYFDYKNIVLFGDHTVSLYLPRAPFLVSTDGIKALEVTNFSGNFLYVLLEKYKPKSQGYKRHFSILKQVCLSFPNSEEERTSLGEIFSSIDKMLTLHQRINTNVEWVFNLSVTFMEKVVRDWEQRKLGEVSQIVGGGTPSTSNFEYWDGNINWFAPAEIMGQRFVKTSKRKITGLGLKKSSARILPVGTVLFTSRAGIGKTAILAKESTTNQGFQSIVPNDNQLDSYFIFSQTKKLKRFGETNGAGSTFVEVSGKTMAKMPISVPNIDEQKKIGNVIEEVDNVITLHQRKVPP